MNIQGLSNRWGKFIVWYKSDVFVSSTGTSTLGAGHLQEAAAAIPVMFSIKYNQNYM